MKDSKLDKLFFDGLSGEAQFNRQQKQWKIVEERLDKNKRRWIWVLSSGLGSIALLAVLVLTNLEGSTEDKKGVVETVERINQESGKEIELTFLNKDIIKTDNRNNQDIQLVSPKKEEAEKQLERQRGKKIITKENEIEKTETLINKEKCDCPDDENRIADLDTELAEIKSETVTLIPSKELANRKIAECLIVEGLSFSTIRSASSQTRTLLECGEYNIVAKTNKWTPQIKVFAGGGQDMILRDNPADTNRMYPLVGINFGLTRSMSFEISYSQSKYSITHISEYPDFSFLPDYNPIGAWSITKTNLNLKTRNLDLTFKYNIFPDTQFGLSPILGMRLTNSYDADLKVEYQDIYLVDATEFALDAQSFKLNYWTTGLDLSYNLLPYSVGLSFRTMIPRTESVYTFSDLYSIQASIRYRLK